MQTGVCEASCRSELESDTWAGRRVGSKEPDHHESRTLKLQILQRVPHRGPLIAVFACQGKEALPAPLQSVALCLLSLGLTEAGSQRGHICLIIHHSQGHLTFGKSEEKGYPLPKPQLATAPPHPTAEQAETPEASDLSRSLSSLLQSPAKSRGHRGLPSHKDCTVYIFQTE